LSGDDQPVCSACQSPLTVKHFSLNVLILLLSVAGILMLLQWKMYLKVSTHKAL